MKTQTTYTGLIIATALYAFFNVVGAATAGSSDAQVLAPTAVAIQQPRIVQPPSVYGQPTANQPTPTLQEVDAYKLLYESSKDAQQTLISTMQWSIALVAAVIFGIIGSQVFFNYRLGKGEIEALEKKLAKLIADSKETVGAELRAEVTKLRDESQTQLSTREQLIVSNIQNMFQSVQKQVDAQEANIKTSMAASAAIVEMRINVIDMNLKNLDARMWEKEGVLSNALTSYVQSVELELRTSIDARYSLEKVIAVLKKLSYVYDVDIPRLEGLIRLLPEKYAEQKEAIATSLHALPVKELYPEKQKNTVESPA